MIEDSLPFDSGDSSISFPKDHLTDDDRYDSSAIIKLRLRNLERRIEHLEKVIQRQIRLGRMVE